MAGTPILPPSRPAVPGPPVVLVYTGRMPTRDAHSHAPADATSPARFLALLDYDGTMTTHECNEIALQRFVGDAWKPLEVEAKADLMSHAECFDRQVQMVPAPRAQFVGALVDAAEPMPGLAEFFAAAWSIQTPWSSKRMGSRVSWMRPNR